MNNKIVLAKKLLVIAKQLLTAGPKLPHGFHTVSPRSVRDSKLGEFFQDYNYDEEVNSKLLPLWKQIGSILASHPNIRRAPDLAVEVAKEKFNKLFFSREYGPTVNFLMSLTDIEPEYQLRDALSNSPLYRDLAAEFKPRVITQFGYRLRDFMKDPNEENLTYIHEDYTDFLERQLKKLTELFNAEQNRQSEPFKNAPETYKLEDI